MDFYKMLSDYYDEIFPVNRNLVNIIINLTPENVHVLDVGCATGALVRELVNEGFDCEGLEYVPELIKYNEKVSVGDMHKLPYDDNRFDTLLCTGNTLAHVKDPVKAEQVLGEFSRVLKKGGKAVIQILNYGMILRNKPANLPLIKTEHVTFERRYEYLQDNIKFSGRLSTGSNTQESYVDIYPLTDRELDVAAILSGFKVDNTYGGFDGSDFDIEKSLPLIKILSRID